MSRGCEQVPAGYIYDVITNGFGGMLGYSAQIPPLTAGPSSRTSVRCSLAATHPFPNFHPR